MLYENVNAKEKPGLSPWSLTLNHRNNDSANLWKWRETVVFILSEMLFALSTSFWEPYDDIGLESD